jgi:WD40 repeat protein/tRNA A-37 threonylcarbamoyl transferase component Bud32
MSRPIQQATCPVCSTTLLDAVFTGICVACAWQDAAMSEEKIEATENTAALFRVPGYDVLDEIGRGGGGVVYRARQLSPPRDVAIKMLLPHQLNSDGMVERFKVEAETIATLDHPAILPVFAAAVHRGVPFFAMKLATGGTLAGRQKNFAGQWRDIAQLVTRIADAVHFAHSRGVIHRDLKPANILFDEADRPFITDFGIAKFTAVESLTTRTLNVLGTPAYLAPEVAEHGTNAATTSSDVYGIGGIFYELLTGAPPFSAASLPSLLKDVIETAPDLPRRRHPGVPRDLEVICLRCLAKDPVDRFTSAGELSTELQRWSAGVPILSRPISPVGRAWLWCRRRPALAGLTAALFIAIVIAAVVQVRANRQLTIALVATRSAETEAVSKLQASLLSEAQVRRHSGSMGQRYETLKLLDRAARISPTMQVRSALAAALAEPDLEVRQTFALKSLSHTTALTFGPDLSLFLTASQSGAFELRRGEDGRVVRQFETPGKAQARSFAFSRNGRYFSVQHSGSTSFWTAESGTPLFVLPRGGNGASLPHCLHPIQPIVAHGTANHGIVLHDLKTESWRPVAHVDSPILALSFDPEGKRLAVIRENAITLVDTTTGRVHWSVDETPAATLPVWNADGTLLAHASFRRNEIRIRQAGSGELQQVFSGHTAVPERLVFHPDGRTLVSGAFDMSVRLWDIEGGREMVRATLPLSGFQLSEDGQRIGSATDSESAAIFQWAPRNIFQEFRGSPRLDARVLISVVASKNGRWLAANLIEEKRNSAGRNSSHVRTAIWDADEQREVAEFNFPAAGWATVSFDPDSSAVLYGCNNTPLHRRPIALADGRFNLGPEETLGGPNPAIFLGSSNENGDWLMHRPKDGALFAWPAGDSRRERRIAPLPTADRGIVISADAQWAAITTAAPSVQVWPLNPSTIAQPKTLDVDRPVDVCFSADSLQLLAGNGWKFQTWTLPGFDSGPAWSAQIDGDRYRVAEFSRDGRWLATEVAQGTLEIRDTRTFETIIRLEPPKNTELSRMTWSPDGSRIYLVGRGGRVFAWNLQNLRKELAARGLDW